MHKVLKEDFVPNAQLKDLLDATHLFGNHIHDTQMDPLAFLASRKQLVRLDPGATLNDLLRHVDLASGGELFSDDGAYSTALANSPEPCSPTSPVSATWKAPDESLPVDRERRIVGAAWFHMDILGELLDGQL